MERKVGLCFFLGKRAEEVGEGGMGLHKERPFGLFLVVDYQIGSKGVSVFPFGYLFCHMGKKRGGFWKIMHKGRGVCLRASCELLHPVPE